MIASVLSASIVAGIFWGVWPFVLNKSGLPPSVGVMLFGLGSLSMTTMLTFRSWSVITTPNWSFAILAGAIGAVGTVIFVGWMPTDPEVIARYFVLNLVIQTSVPAVYNVYVSGASPAKVAGFILAGVAAFLLKM